MLKSKLNFKEIIKKTPPGKTKLARDVYYRFKIFSYNFEAPEYLDNFFISAVIAVFTIRLSLKFIGWYQIGSETLHIAHMLWGGLFMLTALVIAILFLNKEAKQTAAILGGLGFGTFIDELGKFITRDNDYFFEPAAAIMYIIFAVMFLFFRKVIRNIKPYPKDYALNALETIKELIFYDLDIQEKERALTYLEKSDQSNPLINELYAILNSKSAIPRKERQIFATVKRFLYQNYLRLIKIKKFANIISLVFAANALINIFTAIIDIKKEYYFYGFWEWGAIFSTLTTGVFVLWGMWFLQSKKRIKAYEKFKDGVLFYIFVGHFFVFYHEQLSAAFSLFLNISVYVAVQYLIDQERLLKAK